MDHSRRVSFGYDAWSRGWLYAAHPARRLRPAYDPRLPAPTFGLLTQMRSYLDGSVPS
jgi:hypothetical protein